MFQREMRKLSLNYHQHPAAFKSSPDNVNLKVNGYKSMFVCHFYNRKLV